MPLPLSNHPMSWLRSARTESRFFLAAAVISAAAALSLAPRIAAAEENPACEQFAWSVKRELALFAASNFETVFSGAMIPALPEKGIVIELQPHVTVDYVLPPGREPKSEDSKGGVVSISNVPKGSYQITLSEHAWIDVIQNGKELAPTAHTGKLDCAGVRKSVRFGLEPGPLTIQVSGAASNQIKLAILPVE